MKLGRRKFFGLMVAAPVAAKGTVEAAFANVRADGLASGQSFLPAYPPCQPVSGGSSVPWHKKVLGFIKDNRIPEWLLEEKWEETKFVNALDPDIACKRSWSMSVKILEQRQRNYKKVLAGIEKSAKARGLHDAFYEKFGFNL